MKTYLLLLDVTEIEWEAETSTTFTLNDGGGGCIVRRPIEAHRCGTEAPPFEICMGGVRSAAPRCLQVRRLSEITHQLNT